MSASLVPPHSSLVRYDNPILVSTTKSYNNSSSLAASKQQQSNIDRAALSHLTPTEDILNSILPPREWTEDGSLWVQYVSSTPATRSDLLALQEQLDNKLVQRQARETGICPIREELYAQCFDELIREITINCAEQGLLLLRVRDELRSTISCYQTLYESSIAFGMRKSLSAEQYKIELLAKIKAAEAEKRESEKLISEWSSKCDMAEKKEIERKREEETKHFQEVELLKKQNMNLKNELENLLTIPTQKPEIQS